MTAKAYQGENTEALTYKGGIILPGLGEGHGRVNPGRPDTLHGAKERVTIEQMIEASILNEACQMKCEDRLGSITGGSWVYTNPKI